MALSSIGTVRLNCSSCRLCKREYRGGRRGVAYHVLPNCDHGVSGRACEEHSLRALTFSKPKNLSLPSPRKGPALTRSFSSGVASGAFLMGVEPTAGLDGA